MCIARAESAIKFVFYGGARIVIVATAQEKQFLLFS